MIESVQSKSKKIAILFLLLLFAFVVFAIVMAGKAVGSRHTPGLYTSSTTKAMRGNIISADGFHIATTRKLYKVTVDTRSIDPGKKNLFIQLFSIYSGIKPAKIRKILNSRRGSVVLSYDISPKRAQYLKSLAFELRRLGVFVEYEIGPDRTVLRGLNVIESGEARIYPYGELLTPLIGYPRKYEDDGYTRNRGIKGLEKQYNDLLKARSDGYAYAPRDVNNYKILTKESRYSPPLNGYNLQLTIPVTLQIRVERILDAMKADLGAEGVMAVVMESGSGNIVTMASSNRFYPTAIRRSDYNALNTGPLEYSFEPGSVLKPLVFSLLLEHGKITPYDIVNGHGGRYRIGRKVITDEHKFDWLSAENVIVYSSNVGIAQLAQKLDPAEFTEGLKSFGLTRPTGMRFPYEKTGVMPAMQQLNSPIYKATAAYGYSVRVTLMQLIKAYDVFNNDGIAVTPTDVKQWIDPVTGEKHPFEKAADKRVISAATAARMKQILVKTVNEGTGVHAITPGILVGGKTGTAQIAVNGRYARLYNASFIGFADDASGHRYTIGVTVVKPKKYHFASLTAVVTAKKIIDMMVREGYLVADETAIPPVRRKPRHAGLND